MKKVLLFLCVFFLGITAAQAAGKKKVLYVNAYHEGYAWSDAIAKGIKSVFGDTVELKTVLMNGKLKPAPADLQNAALEVKKTIETYKPDLVITPDDIPAKYVIVPFYKDSKLPFVFCGLNWDCSVYGFPSKNVTGVLEIAPYAGLLKVMRKYAKGDQFRLGIIAPDIETSRKELENARKIGLAFTEYMAKDVDDYLAKYKQAQGEVDMLILESDGGLYDPVEEKVKQFVSRNTEIITGSCYDFMVKYSMTAFAKLGEEQGELAARMALDILGGKKISDIPVGKNVQGVLLVNKKLAEAGKIEIKEMDLKTAIKVVE